jgi:hypothetical protein
VPCKDCEESICPEARHARLRLIDPLEVVQAGCELVQESGSHLERNGAVEQRGALWEAGSFTARAAGVLVTRG